MGEYLGIANSTLLFIVVAVVLLIVAFQSVLFIRTAMKRAGELGISKETVNKSITNSAVFSILPSLPIIITMLAMMPALGKFIPWLRLSVIGSAMYESMAADMAIKSLGFTGLGDMSITNDVFLSIVWVMTLGTITGPLLCTLFLKPLDTKAKNLLNRGGFVTVAMGAVFTGFMASSSVPRMLNYEAPLEVIVFIGAGIMAILLVNIGKKTNIKLISEFSFPLAMVFGMCLAILFSGISA